MGIFSKLLGTDKVIDSGIKGIDSIFYTDQERAENKKAFLKLYEPFKLAQRYISLIFCIPYALMCMVTFGASFFMDVTVQKELLMGDLSTIVGIIVAFYFLGGSLAGGFKK